MDPSQLIGQLSKEQAPRRAYWLLGDPVLAYECSQAIQASTDPSTTAYYSLKADDPTLWDALTHTPLDEDAHRFITVTDPHLFTDHKALAQWVKEKHKGITVIFQSPQSRWEPPHWSSKTHSAHLPSLKKVFTASNTSTAYVDAHFADSAPGRKKFIEFAGAQWAPNMPKALVEKAVVLCEYDPVRTRDALSKAKHFSQISEKALAILCRRADPDEYVQALLRMDKAAAHRSAVSIPPEQVPQVLGALDHYLDVLGALHRARGAGEHVYTQASRLGLRPQDLIAVKPYVKHYDTKSIARRSALVNSLVPHAYAQGALQVLTAKW